jgi:predicted nucleotide-binding protein
MKPRVFVGSSSEGREIANALHANLQDVAEVTVWDQDIFRPSEYFLEALLRALESVDFGVFVFSQDDEVVMRGTSSSTVRDNVVFELGLFVGRLGRKRSIFVKPKAWRCVSLPICKALARQSSRRTVKTRTGGQR